MAPMQGRKVRGGGEVALRLGEVTKLTCILAYFFILL